MAMDPATKRRLLGAGLAGVGGLLVYEAFRGGTANAAAMPTTTPATPAQGGSVAGSYPVNGPVGASDVPNGTTTVYQSPALSAAALADPATQRIVVSTMQRQLRSLGFDPGGIDGSYGANTQRALGSFLASVGYTIDPTDPVAALADGANKVDDRYRARFGGQIASGDKTGLGSNLFPSGALAADATAALPRVALKQPTRLRANAVGGGDLGTYRIGVVVQVLGQPAPQIEASSGARLYAVRVAGTGATGFMFLAASELMGSGL